MKKEKEPIVPFDQMSVSEKMRKATELGDRVGKILEKAKAEANKILKPYNYCLNDMKIDFCEIKKDE